MTSIPGTNFTKEQLEADLKIDNITTIWSISVANKWVDIGLKYRERKQYDKAMAWFLLTANDSLLIPEAFNNIGEMYHKGIGVPVNFLCALKWYIKAAAENYCDPCFKNIGELFENGLGVPIDKLKALEWYCHHPKNKTYSDNLKIQGYHRSSDDKSKKRKQLRIETEAILEAEKKKLEEKVYKTQKETETLEQLEATYTVFGIARGYIKAPGDIPILISDNKQNGAQSVNESIISYEGEIPRLENSAQLLEQEKVVSEHQIEQLQLLTQEKLRLELQIKDKDSRISSLESENQELKVKSSHFELRLKEKDSIISYVQTENKSLIQEKAISEHLLANEKRRTRALKHENRELKQERTRQQTTVQTTNTLNNNTSSNNASTSHHDDYDDPQNDINYDTEFDTTEESDNGDINYDTPNEEDD